MNENMQQDGIYIVQDGNTTHLEPKEHGQDTIFWKNGQVLDVERAHRIRVKQSK